MLIGQSYSVVVSVAFVSVVAVLSSTPNPNDDDGASLRNSSGGGENQNRHNPGAEFDRRCLVQEASIYQEFRFQWAVINDNLDVELRTAVERNDTIETIQLLIEQSANPTTENPDSPCHLYMATTRSQRQHRRDVELQIAFRLGGNMETIRRLLALGADPVWPDEYLGAYFYAAHHNNVELLGALQQSRHYHPRYLNAPAGYLCSFRKEPIGTIVNHLLTKEYKKEKQAHIEAAARQAKEETRLAKENERREQARKEAEAKLEKEKRKLEKRLAANRRIQEENRQIQERQLRALESDSSVVNHVSSGEANAHSIQRSHSISPTTPEPIDEYASQNIPPTTPEPIDEYERQVMEKIRLEKNRNRMDWLDTPVIDEPPKTEEQLRESKTILDAKALEKETIQRKALEKKSQKNRKKIEQ